MSALRKEIEELSKDGNVIPVKLDLPADTVTPVAVFLRLRQREQDCCFLESVEGGERIARYSFVGVQPFGRIRIQKNSVMIETKDREEVIEGNPFDSLKAFFSKYRSVKREGFPPFCGGAVGFVGYECIQYVENLNFVIDQRDSDEAYLMLFRTVVAYDRLEDRISVISNIFTEEESIDDGISRIKSEQEKIAKAIFTPTEQESQFEVLDLEGVNEQIDETPVLGRDQYVSKVKKIKSHIRAGDIFQGVLSDQFSVEIHSDPFSIYRNLRGMNPSPYMFFLQMKDKTLLGASPEMLVRVDGRKVQTCPIAGTRPRGRTETEDRKLERDLLASVKERAEHLMLVDLGRNDVGSVSKPGSVHVEEFMQVYRYSHVMHLVSLVEGRLQSKLSGWDAFCSCFPAGTLTGAPKIRAMEILSEQETVARGPYGGAIVYYDFGGGLDSCITIRSLLVKDNKGYIQAGAGIVADSNPQKEYDEVLHKARSIRRAIALTRQRSKGDSA